MREVNVLLESIEKVKAFVSITTKYDVDMDLESGRYIIDAKSILGIFSMDLSKPLRLRIHAEGEKTEEILEALREFATN